MCNLWPGDSQLEWPLQIFSWYHMDKKVFACSCILQLVWQGLHESSDFIEKDTFKTGTKGMEGMVLFQNYLMTEIHCRNSLFLFFFRS